MEDFKEWSENIKNSLTIEQVSELVFTFGGDPIVKENIILCQTICHGGDSHKLYYYDNTKLFKCYTQCAGDSFDIFDLILRVKKNQGTEISLMQAVYFVANFYNLPLLTKNLQNSNDELEDWKILNKYEQNTTQKKQEKIVELKFYEEDILKFLPSPRIIGWEKEGITNEVIIKNNIKYDPVQQGIVIPHYDENRALVGIRERTLIKENEKNGKYKPAILNYKMYNHPLGFTLYGLDNAKENIKKIGKAIVFEGEKSVLLYQSYFGIDNSIAVATCGSNLTLYQINLLIKNGAKEIVIAFDRQFQTLGDEEWKLWTKKLKELHKKYSSLVQISFMFDKWELLGYKDSPIDCGKEKFLELFNKRVVL